MLRPMRPFLAIATVSAAVCGLIVSGVLLIGVEGQWAYGLFGGHSRPRYDFLQIPIVAATILALVVWAGMKRIEAARWPERAAWVAGLGVAGFLNLMGLVLVSRAGAAEPGYLHYVDWSGGYFNDAIRLRDEPDVIRRYPEFLARLSEHGRSHPPGTMMVNLWALRFFERRQEWGAAINRTALEAGADLTTLPRSFGRATPVPVPADWEQGACHFVAWSILAFGVTVAVPVYLLAATLVDRPTGLAAAGLSLVVPSLAFFEPLMDLTYPVFTTWGLWFMARGFAGRWIWWSACGFIVGLGLFLSYNQWAALPVVGLWILAEARRSRSWKTVWPASAAVAGGLLASALVQWAVLGYHPITDFFVRQPWRVARGELLDPSLGFHRPYLVWVWADLLEFFTFVGIPVSIALFWEACGGSNPRSGAFAVAVLGGILFLDLMGVTRSEVARLWMFLMPAAVAAAAPRLKGGAVLMLALMALQSLLFKLFLTTNNLIS